MEDDLKISKVENLSNHWSDLPQIVNLNLEDQTKFEYCLKRRGHPIEDISATTDQTSSKHMGPNQNLNLLKMKMTSNVRQSKNIKSGSTSHWILLKLS